MAVSIWAILASSAVVWMRRLGRWGKLGIGEWEGREVFWGVLEVMMMMMMMTSSEVKGSMITR